MTDDTLTQQEYDQEIRELAEEAQRRVDEDDEDMSDVLHEMIDSHEWVIYTHKARQVMVRTNNPNAWEDLFGDQRPKVEVEAFCAMEADVRARLD